MAMISFAMARTETAPARRALRARVICATTGVARKVLDAVRANADIVCVSVRAGVRGKRSRWGPRRRRASASTTRFKAALQSRKQSQ